MIVDKECVHCGKAFRVKHTEVGKYCGNACYRAHEALHGRPTRTIPVEFHCKSCGNAFERNPGELRQYRNAFGHDPMYCSISCSNAGRKADTEAEWDKKCIVCGAPIAISRREDGTYRRAKTICSSACRRAHKLAEHERLRPSDSREIQRNITSQGYVRLRFPNKNGVKGREVLEHRLVMERHLGRELLPEETVHHRDGNRENNTLSNIELFTSQHGPGQRVIDQITFAIAMIRLYPEFAREQGFVLMKV